MATNNVPAGTEQRFLGVTNIAALVAAKALPVEQIERKLEEFFDLLGATTGAGTALPELAGYCEAMLGRLLEAQPVAKPTDPLAAADARVGLQARDADGNLATMSHDLTNGVNQELFDLLTLLHASMNEIDAIGSEQDEDPDHLTSASSRAGALVLMASAKVRAMLATISPYV